MGNHSSGRASSKGCNSHCGCTPGELGAASAQFNFPMADSARLMPVTTSPMPAHTPSPASSPETRRPKGVEIPVGHRAQHVPAPPHPASTLDPTANCVKEYSLPDRSGRQSISSCCNFASALPQAKLCANRVVTTRRQPVVTTRKLPQLPWADHRP